MPRPSRFQILKYAKPRIAAVLEHYGNRVFSESEFQEVLLANRDNWNLANITTFQNFVDFLVEQNIITVLLIKTTPKKHLRRFLFGSPSIYEIALSLSSGSYLTHFSALHLHALTEEVPKTIYINREQSSPGGHIYGEELEQKRIDFAFSRPMRKSNLAKELIYDKTAYRIITLNGRNTGRLGVTELDLGGTTLRTTNLERTLIDATVRPDYSGGVINVFLAYQNAKPHLSVNRLVAYLKRLEYKYPYHQSVGFYLENAGYGKDALQLLEEFEIKYKFYLAYKMPKKKFSEKWGVFYPDGLFPETNSA